ncbi:MAG: hypothetical protein HUJ53_00700, partial [Holdemanella sp.]|nr:hypothetical protein [Holdemanella sp.]
KDASEQYKETNKDVLKSEKANERLKDAMAKLGEIGEPAVTAIKDAIADLADKIAPKVEDAVEKLKDITKWMSENKEKVKLWAGVVGIATLTLAGFVLVLEWSTLMSKASKGLQAFNKAFKALNTTMKANVIGLIVVAIVGLVAMFIYLWNNCDGFREFWIGLWKKIVSIAKSAWKAITDKWDGIKDFFGNLIKGISKKFKDMKKTVSDIFDGIYKAIKKKIEQAKDVVGKVIDKIKGFFKFKWSLPKLKLPSFKFEGKFDLKKLSVPKLKIKWNAEGGILNDATIFGMQNGTLLGGGEAGKEAIVPLERNTEWIDMIADRLHKPDDNSELISRMNVIIELLEKQLGISMDVYLDSGTLVGEIAPMMDRELGRLSNKKVRMNL